MQEPRAERVSSNRYLNCVLTAIAVLLGVLALQRSDVMSPNEAFAGSSRGPSTPLGIPNAADQRKRIAESVDAIGTRLKQLETKINNGTFDVRVVSMPPVEIAE